MPINPTNFATGSGKPNSNSVRAEANADNRDVKDVRAESKKAYNAAILAAHERVSLNSSNDALSLLYKTALEGINAELEPVMGKNAAKKIYESGVDTSPKATADRIVSFATNFYSRYKELNPGGSEEETLNNFLELIKGGIDKGFNEAVTILQGLQVYEGKVESDADETYKLIEQGLESFREQVFGNENDQGESANED
ncbi:DUF5610 domain-containing protein [Idiomarina sp.]|uniref:DUF5610 domain-containing protein n=1 Tax=Idiomarina sp. TaxID=1874361 RepID=UPI0025C637B6|nr:DUF5610 domain-containing protein [Idiomarina sp.]